MLTVNEGEDNVAKGDVTVSRQLKIVVNDKTHIFMANSGEERDQWLVALRTNSLLVRVGSRKGRTQSGFLKKSDITATSKKKTRYFKQNGHLASYYQNEKAVKPLGKFTLKEATITPAGETDIEVYSGFVFPFFLLCFRFLFLLVHDFSFPLSLFLF